MDQNRITLQTRRGIREPKPVTIQDPEIEVMTLQGVLVLGLQIKSNDPSYYNTRKSLSSYTHVFSKPSDCLTILRVWDLGTNALEVAGAADNGSGLIRITTTDDHDLTDGDIVVIHDVGGCTEANDTWQIEYDDTTMAATEFDLVGSTFANAWTSGGKVFVDPLSPDEITRKLLKDATASDSSSWYPRGSFIVVDDKTFTNDILIDYIRSPSAITDIPAEYHMGLVAWNVVNLIRIPNPQDPQDGKEYADKVAQKQLYVDLLKLTRESISATFRVSTGPKPIPDEMNYEAYQW